MLSDRWLNKNPEADLASSGPLFKPYQPLKISFYGTKGYRPDRLNAQTPPFQPELTLGDGGMSSNCPIGPIGIFSWWF
jgi:hypothetical protein